MLIDAFFLPVGNGQRFCIASFPDDGREPIGVVVYAPPFAEELNKARRMAALQARALAGAGYLVVQIDLEGCGDSSGEFVQATWEGWLLDLAAACAWGRSRVPGGALWLWGLRAGCLLATELAGRLDEPVGLLLWQPLASGKLLLQQFLRLRLASGMLGGDARGGMEALRQQLARGESVEVAGYMLSSALAAGLESAESRYPATASRIEWIEVSGNSDAGLSPLALKRVESWQASGGAVRAQMVAGPAFWQTAEIEECPALIDVSVSAIAAGAV